MLTPPGLTPIEMASGIPFGPAAPDEIRRASGAPMGVMDALLSDLAPYSARGQMVVWVSGDDGTAIVASAAVEAARRAGAPKPVAITPQLPGRTQSDYPESVVRALGFEEWLRPDVSDSVGLLGPTAQDCLLRHGPFFPSVAYLFVPMLAASRGGTLICGHSMEEVWMYWRGAVIARILQHRRIHRRDLPALALLLPLPVRRRLARRVVAMLDVPYLREPVRSQARRLAVDDALSGSVRLWKAGRKTIERACVPRAMTIYEKLAADHDADFLFAWASPTVADAIVNDTRGFKPLSPSVYRRRVVPSLPNRGSGRVTFPYEAVWEDAETQAFIEAWDGTGLDEGLIDPVALRAAWRRGDWQSGMLLHSAWLYGRQGGGAATKADSAQGAPTGAG